MNIQDIYIKEMKMITKVTNKYEEKSRLRKDRYSVYLIIIMLFLCLFYRSHGVDAFFEFVNGNAFSYATEFDHRLNIMEQMMP